MSTPFRGEYFDQVNHYTTPTASGYTRHLPFDYFPRWFEGYYNEDSELRRIYGLGLIYYKNQVLTIRPGHLTPAFYGPISTCRAGYTARIINALQDKPRLSLVSNLTSSMSGAIRQADTLGSFYYEKIEPIFFVNEDGSIQLKNLESISVYVQAASGILDLTTQFTNFPALEDSPISFTNQWGDTFHTDFEDKRWSSNKFVIGKTAWFKISYLCSTVRSSLLTNTSSSLYVTHEGNRVNLVQNDFDNTWDEYANWHGFVRRSDESNVSVKGRCQHRSLSHRLTDRLSAVLGRTKVGYWDQQQNSTYTPVASGTSIFLWETPQYSSVKEHPYLDSSNNQDLLLKYTPSSSVQLFFDGFSVDPTHYIQNGGKLTLLTETLKTAERGRLEANYLISNYDVSYDSGFVTSVAKNSSYKYYQTVLVAHDVRVIPSEKKDKIWQWSLLPVITKGSATFE